jgi:HAD superfamily hydrolase (TIGR01509 family)
MIRAVIFDLDGVLVDAKELHYEALNRSLGQFGYTISRDEHLSTYDGLPTNKKLELLSKHKGLAQTHYKEIWEGKQVHTLAIISEEYTYDERIREILIKLRQQGYSIVVCSNSIRDTVKMMLLRKGFMEFVDFFISNQDVVHPKPNPEMYLRAMVKLGVCPKECLIIEDSHHGRQAAFDSGAHLCAVEFVEDVTYERIFNTIEHAKQQSKQYQSVPKWKSDKLRIVVPMAGEGKSFKKAGYTFPKPLVDINGKPMIQWVIENINVDGKFIFIVRKEDYDQYAMPFLLKLIAPNCEIIALEESTGGAAKSVLQASHLFDDEDPIVIINSDQLLEWNCNEFFYAMATDGCDGGIVTFESIHPQWSFAKIDEQGYVTETAEKKPISNHATAGVYYFKKGKEFIQHTQEMIDAEIHTRGEYYICPVYNEYIKEQKKIRTFPIENIWSFSTPKEVEVFLSKYC